MKQYIILSLFLTASLSSYVFAESFSYRCPNKLKINGTFNTSILSPLSFVKKLATRGTKGRNSIKFEPSFKSSGTNMYGKGGTCRYEGYHFFIKKSETCPKGGYSSSQWVNNLPDMRYNAALDKVVSYPQYKKCIYYLVNIQTRKSFSECSTNSQMIECSE